MAVSKSTVQTQLNSALAALATAEAQFTTYEGVSEAAKAKAYNFKRDIATAREAIHRCLDDAMSQRTDLS